MRPDLVVDPFPFFEHFIHHGNLPITGIYLIELFYVLAVRALHISIQLGRTGRQHKQLDVLVLASLFKFSNELAAPIRLHNLDQETHTLLDKDQGMLSVISSGTFTCLHYPPVLVLLFSRFNFRFSFMVSFAFFFCSLFPLSFFPVSPISNSPELIIIRYIYYRISWIQVSSATVII